MAKAGVRGRTVTLKLMRRKAGAPEAPKFLGHGICDNLSRSVTLPRFTASPHDLFVEGRSLLRALRVPATQIRGMGLAVRQAIDYIGLFGRVYWVDFTLSC
jgi:DNA repair protein REV1